MTKRIKGMYDILPPESRIWRRMERTFEDVSREFGFERAATPLIERTELFSRSIGESTDIVEKEMYTFKDRRDRSLSLRPEGTASMVRAYVENKIYAADPVAKWIYSGPMYRYERPQKGRNRQFHQLGAEVFGIEGAEQDAELIAMGRLFFERLGLDGVELKLNSLGDMEERRTYREGLVAYLEGSRDALCDDCRRRLSTNPMRVLDCKVPECKQISKDAPLMLDHLGSQSRTHFETVCRLLEALEIPYEIDKRIVRGLDYYNRTAFEFKSAELGAQDAVGGGGRYDSLVKTMGGPSTPAVGFALGVERIAILLENQVGEENGLDFYFVAMGRNAKERAVVLAQRLRREGLRGEVDFTDRRLKHLFARAERQNARYALILGDAELERGIVQVRDMKAKTQQEIALDELAVKTLE